MDQFIRSCKRVSTLRNITQSVYLTGKTRSQFNLLLSRLKNLCWEFLQGFMGFVFKFARVAFDSKGALKGSGELAGIIIDRVTQVGSLISEVP